jgi:hypothetical protein
MRAEGNEMSRMIIAVFLSLAALGLSACQGNRIQGSTAPQMIH